MWNGLTNIGIERDEAWFIVDDLDELMDNSEKFGGPLQSKTASFGKCLMRRTGSRGLSRVAPVLLI